MRASRRSLALALTILLSVGASPAGASDDGIDLLGDLAKTVVPAPAPVLAAPVLDPVAPSVDAVTDTVKVVSAGSSPLAGAVELLAPQTIPSGSSAAGNDLTAVNANTAPQLASYTRTFSASTGNTAASALTDRLLSVAVASSAPGRDDGSIQRSDLDSATSSLPDGGSPLTLAWFVLCAGLMSAGALVLRRSRAAR